MILTIVAIGYPTRWAATVRPSEHWGAICLQSGRDLILDFGHVKYRLMDVMPTSRPSGSHVESGAANIATFDCGPDFRWGALHLYLNASGYGSRIRAVAPGVQATCRPTDGLTDISLAGHEIRLAEHGATTTVDGTTFGIQEGETICVPKRGSPYLQYAAPSSDGSATKSASSSIF